VNELAQYTVLAERKLQSETQWKKPRSNKNWSNSKFGFYDDGYATQQNQPNRQVPQTQNFDNYQQPMVVENAKYADPETRWSPPGGASSKFAPQRSRADESCYRCGNFGHFSRACPQRQAASPYIIGAHLPRTNMGISALRKIQYIYLLV
jgi:Zinc knuckle